MKFLCFVLLLSYINLSFAQTEEEITKASESYQWRSLLKYRRLILLRSLNDDPRFFLSPSGKRSPYKELKENLLKLKKNREYRCQFPARTRFLIKEFDLDSSYLDQNHCVKLQRFRREHKTRSVSLIFVSFYTKNIKTMYGETILRLSRSSNKDDRSELADHAVSFGPNVDIDNLVVAGVKHFNGGFKGTFNTDTYYNKINNIDFIEARDLWSYNLDLNRKQSLFLIDHLWEMNRAYFDFHTIDENSSYHILSLLDAVNPEWKLLDKFSYMTSFPSEVIKIVKNTNNLVTDETFIPSKLTIFKDKFNKLDSQQKSSLINYVESDFNDKYIARLSAFEQSQVLDAAVNYFDFQNSNSIIKEDLKITARKQIILEDRSQTPIMNTELDIKTDEQQAPHLIHKPSKVSLGTSSWEGVNFTTLTLNSSYHDFLDDSSGLPKAYSLMTPSISMIYNNDVLLVDKINILTIENIQDWNRLVSKFSYKLSIGSNRLFDVDECSQCTASFVKGSFGVAKITNRYFAFAGVYQEAQFNAGLSEDLDYGIGVDLTAGLIFPNEFKLKLNYETKRYVFNGFNLPIMTIEAQKNFKSNYGAKFSLVRYPDSERTSFDVSLRF